MAKPTPPPTNEPASPKAPVPVDPGLETQFLLAGILHARVPDPELLGEAIGSRLRLIRISDPIETFEADMPEASPYQRAELRLNRSRGTATLAFAPRREIRMTESSVANSALSKAPPILDVNLHVPPEGTRTLIYKREDADIHFSFTLRSGTLRALMLEWKRQPQPSP